MDRRNLVIVALAIALVAFSIADRRDPLNAAEAAGAAAPSVASTPL